MPKNIIVSCQSTVLTQEEKRLFRELQPWGFILFSRNIAEPQQVKDLIDQMKEACQRDKLMVFIDQEGGRVSRLPKSYWRVPPSPTVFANRYHHSPEIAKRACLLNACLTGLELKQLGINANCAPLLDIPQANAASIISERALGSRPQQVIELGRQICNGLKRAHVAPVIKHMPGHGRATSDSHLSLPRVSDSITKLLDWDFLPFQALADESMAMTAHILFDHIDRNLPVTISAKAMETVIRTTIGFKGLIMTDDINMQALSGSIAERAKQALDAGCDIALHCSGELGEMQSLLCVATDLEGESLQRAKRAEELAFKPQANISIEEISLELDELLAIS